MKKAKSYHLTLCLFFFTGLFILSSYAKGEEEVKSITVIAEAPIINGNVSEARNNALEEAFRSAIRKLIGTYVTAGNYTRNFVSIENSIITRSKGYINSYDVLKEWDEEQILYREVLIKVSMKPMLDKLSQLGILIQSMGDPRTTIIIFQQNEAGEFVYDSTATNSIKDHFVNVGFQIIDSNPATLLQEQEQFRKLFNGDSVLIEWMASKTGAEIIVIGQGTARNQTVASPLGLYAALVSLHVKLIKPQTKKTLVSLTERGNGSGLTIDAALKQAFEKSGKNIAPKLVHSLAEKWNSELLNGRRINMEVNTADYEIFQNFRKRMEKIFGILRAISKSFKNGKGEIEIRFTGSPQTLTDLILMTDFDNLKVKIKSFTDDQIVLKIE